MNVNAIAVSLVIEPFALKHITVDVPEFAATTRFVQSPEAFVAGTIGPDLNSEPMLHVAEPLTFVYSSVFENDVSPLFDHLTREVFLEIDCVHDSFRARHILHVQISLTEVIRHAAPDISTSEPSLQSDNVMHMVDELVLRKRIDSR